MLHLRECHSDYVTAPGDTLHETLETIGMSQSELAQRTGYSEIMVEGVIRGKEIITPEFAAQLEKVLDVPAEFWLRYDKRYQEWLAQPQPEKILV